MNTLCTLDQILSLYEKHGKETYIGEPVSFLQHSLQCGTLAERSKMPIPIIIGAFFHDIGHLIGFELGCAQLVGPDGVVLGTVDHESLGANCLDKLGFPKTVTDVIRYHVDAKRYKVSKDPNYLDNVSPASIDTLKLQGGPMSKDEMAKFALLPNLDVILAVRSFDEAAKDPAMETPPLSYFASMAKSYLQSL